jgi:putative glutathione S-transferase
MGLLIEGQWHDEWYDTEKTKGQFIREKSQFRNWITADGEFAPESGRYHLYVSYACPWAHRTLIFRELKNLTSHISLSAVQPHMLTNGWEFIQNDPAFSDPLYHCRYLYEIYLRQDPKYTGRVTVPVLWDKQKQMIVNNESSEIIRMLNTAFNTLTGNTDDYYPQHLANDIDTINQFVYEKINNGVYRCGFATAQEAYDEAFGALFSALDTLEARLEGQAYLVNNTLTEADWRLFTTLIRFDVVYYSHFKCNLKMIRDYPNLSRYIKKLYHHPSVAQTVKFEQIKDHYYYSQIKINPTQIVPLGPLLDLTQ